MNNPTLTRDKYGSYHIDGEQVYLSFTWQVKARFRRKSKTVRVHEFTVSAGDRTMAIYAASRHYKGAFLQEMISLTPSDFWPRSFWIMREGYPGIGQEILSQLSLPADL